MDRVSRGPLVVVAARVGGGAIVADAAVAVAGQGEEHGRPVAGAVGCGVDLAGGPAADRPPGQVGGVLPVPGGPGTPGPACLLIVRRASGGAGQAASDAGARELVIEFGDELVQLGGVLASRGCLVAADLGVRAEGEPGFLLVVRRRCRVGGFVLEVPAVAALLGAQRPGAFGAGRAGGVEGGAARDQDLGDLAGVEVGAAELDGPDATSAVLGDLPQRITRERMSQPGSAGRPVSHRLPPFGWRGHRWRSSRRPGSDE